jgi:hypothetical protein
MAQYKAASFDISICIYADPSGLAVKGADLWPLGCWNRGFEFH